MLLMAARTISEIVVSPDRWYGKFLNFLGSPTIALIVAVVICYLIMGWRQGMSIGSFARQIDESLRPIGSILAVMGAAGAFNQILIASGIGDVLKHYLAALHFNVYVLAWLIAITLRFAIGNATVAMMTSAGFVGPIIASASHVDIALIVVAIGAGAVGASHVTDPGFWFVKEACGIPLKDMFRTFTVSSTLASVVALGGVLILSKIIAF